MENYQMNDKILFRGKDRSIKSHFYPWSRKLLKPRLILTLRSTPSNNGFCMATDANGSLCHINVITDDISRIPA